MPINQEFSDTYIPMSHAMLRSHALPVQTARRFFTNESATGDVIFDIANNPYVELAILIASPSLHERLKSTTLKSDNRVLEKIRNFLIRMSTRPTPFGLMAGIGVCQWGRSTNVSRTGNIRTRTRLEMDWIIEYVRLLEEKTEIAQKIRWISHTAILVHGGRAIISSSASVSHTRPVRLILEQTRIWAPYTKIRDYVLTEIKSADVAQFDKCFNELRQLGFIYSELTPAITSKSDPLSSIIERLPHELPADVERKALIELRDQILFSDEGVFSDRIVKLQNVADRAQAIKSHKRPFPIQVDLAIELDGETISADVGKEAARAATLLIQTSGLSSAETAARYYYDAFVFKYGTEREVPFLEMAHPELGLGLTPLKQGDAKFSTGPNSYLREQTLHEIVQDALRKSSTTSELNENVIRGLRTEADLQGLWPTSIDLNVFVLSKSVASLNSGDFKILVGPNVGAMKAGRHFARFGDLFPQTTQECLAASMNLDRIRNPSVECVELTYIPVETRLANVSLRLPVLAREANYGVSPGVVDTGVLRLDDLVVGASDGRLYVRSVSTGQRLVFHSNCMLSSHAAPRECQILLALAFDPVVQLTMFRWGSAANGVFLPRITYGRIILHCAQWQLRAPESQLKITFRDWLAEWRTKWLCPEHVYLCAGDNRLLLNLSDEYQVEELRRATIKGGTVILQESLPNFDDAWLSGPDGTYIVEMIVPLRLKRISTFDDPLRNSVEILQRRSKLIKERARTKPPGGDWISLKLYGPRTGENKLIGGRVRHLINNISNDILWYFLRYQDPDPHLRLRFFRDCDEVSASLLPQVSAWAASLLQLELCQSYSFDTYVRELERYGGLNVMSKVEAAFCADSSFAVDMVTCRHLTDEVVIGIFIVDRILQMLGLDQQKRLSWARDVTEIKIQDGKIYREKRNSIISSLIAPPAGQLLEVAGMLERMRQPLAEVSCGVAQAEKTGTLTQSDASIYRSMIHMHCNRVWGIDSKRELEILRLYRRAQEQIAYGSR